MRVCDYLAKTLVNIGVEDVFMVAGGGSMFLTDGLACEQGLKTIPCLHEQAASMAAISYAQCRESYGACFVTTGCGGTNTITGVLHAWQDHLPVIYVSGQCNQDERYTIAKSSVRYIGQQEVDIVPIVQSITKYAVTITDPAEAVYHIQKAIFEASTGCKGPVWLDIPLDVQEAEINPDALLHFEPNYSQKTKATVDELQIVLDSFSQAKRPLVILGAGVRDAKAIEIFDRWIHQYQIPFVATRRGWDIIPKSDPLHIGLADIRGNRCANMAMQNADMLLVIGSRLSMFTTGYNYELFARGADKVIVVDIDEEEHKKGTVHIDHVINADAGQFIEALPALKLKDIAAWREKCIHWKKIFPVFTQEQLNDNEGISQFAFMKALNSVLKTDSIVVTDAGASTEIPMQGLFFTSKKQRYIGSASQCEMGFALPGIVGAGIGKKNHTVIGIMGDGSLQMNIQELQTIITQRLNAKIFIWDNDGYGTIKGHQRNIFKERFVGVDSDTGTAFPNIEKIAHAYGYKFYEVKNLQEMENVLPLIMDAQEPVLCNVKVWKQEANPMVKAKLRMADGRRIALPPEDMFPPVDRELFSSEMIIEPIRWWE